MKTGYYLELLTLETMKFFRSKITKYENGENKGPLEITEAVLVHYSIVSNDWQHDSRISFKFVSKKSFKSIVIHLT